MQVETYTRRSLYKMLRTVYEATYPDKAIAKAFADNGFEIIARRANEHRQSLWLVAIGLPDRQRPERAGYHACVYMGEGMALGCGVKEAKKSISPQVRSYSKLYYLVTSARPSHKYMYKEAAKAANLDGVIFWDASR